MHEQAGRLPHRSGEACHHYEMYEADFDLARSWGHNAHRFSIEWSRIERRSHILGYLYWSLMDNFEGALGRGPRFGLAEVDFETQRRIPRPAAEDFATVCRSRLLRLPEAEGGGG